MFVQEMVGEAIAGVAGGYAVLWLLRRLRLETAVYPVARAHECAGRLRWCPDPRSQWLPGVYVIGGDRRHQPVRSPSCGRLRFGSFCVVGADRPLPPARV